jgi:hypothetical protein
MIALSVSFTFADPEPGESEEDIWLFKSEVCEAKRIRRPFSPKQNKSPARIGFYVFL